ncbi:MAG: TolC family protein, partial [Planctomycetota bacterium]|nr:TolC family protein [Planctomycetota bacterium]
MPTALQLAGANNLQVAIAAEQVREAAASVDRAELLWVPNFSFGVGYNRHDGQIQDTQGQVIDVSRQSAFIGGGPRIGSPDVAGMAGTPRLFVGLNPAEAYFAPLAARQAASATSADRTATFNDTLLDVGLAYYDLAEAELRAAIAAEAVQNLEELVRLTERFEAAGAGVAADSARARAQLADAREAVFRAEEAVFVNSAELARLLRLDITTTLTAAERLPLPVTFIPCDGPLSALVAQGVAARPEISRERFRAAEAGTRLRQERMRPWVPNLYVGLSGGGYGGGAGDRFANFDGRSDLDALAVWELENLG